MIRCIFVVLIWIATLGLLSINMEWSDGWSIHLVGWPDAIMKRKADRQAGKDGKK